jgi:ADP-heptose:LPS heptosyltransferase
MSADSTRAASRRVLVIFPGALGDLMLAAPALDAIARRHRECVVELMARAELARFAAGRMRGVARGHSIDRREVSALFSADPAALASAREFFGPFERIYSFFAADDDGFREQLARCAGGRVTIHPFRPDVPGHVADAYLRSIDEAAIATAEPLVEAAADDIAAASSALARAGVDASAVLLMFPGSGSAAKNWPRERFAALAESVARGGLAPVFVLGPAEAAMRRYFATRGSAELAELELGTLAALARIARAFVGNDSGVSHLAAAAGTPGVVLFGPTDPARWTPRGRVTIVRRAPIDAIEPSEVAAALGAMAGYSR